MKDHELIKAYNEGKRDFRGANLRGADLWGADLRGANLWGAGLWDANLRGANLSDANMNWQSHDLIAERLRQAAGDDWAKLSLAGVVIVGRQHCWKWHLERCPLFLKEWAIAEMTTWLKPDEKPAWEVA